MSAMPDTGCRSVSDIELSGLWIPCKEAKTPADAWMTVHVRRRIQSPSIAGISLSEKITS